MLWSRVPYENLESRWCCGILGGGRGSSLTALKLHPRPTLCQNPLTNGLNPSTTSPLCPPWGGKGRAEYKIHSVTVKLTLSTAKAGRSLLLVMVHGSATHRWLSRPSLLAPSEQGVCHRLSGRPSIRMGVYRHPQRGSVLFSPLSPSQSPQLPTTKNLKAQRLKFTAIHPTVKTLGFLVEFSCNSFHG